MIENEFGEVGIDGGFLKDAGIEITEMNSGCICCTLVGDFSKSMREVLEKFSPDRILIEPSGVGKLSDVMSSVIDMEKEADVKLNALVTVVNALKASKQMKAFGEFFNNQIEHATTVVLSRTQKATPQQLEFCTTQIQKLNPQASVITTPWDEITGKQILEVIEGHDNLDMRTLADLHHHEEEAAHSHEHHHEHEEHECHEHHHEHEYHHEHDEEGHCCCGHEHHEHHHADEIFDTWGKETPHIFERKTIENALKVFAETQDYGIVIRSKGMVPCTDGSWAYFDLVDGEYELRTGSPDYTGRLVVIGSHICEDDLEQLFGLV